MNKIDFIANVRHIAWVSYQIAAEQPYNEKINEDQLESLTDGVTFMLMHPYLSPRENHDNWMQMKTSQGWVYGDVKNLGKKTHPNLVPFDKLSEIEKRKDVADILAHQAAIKLWNSIHGE